MDVAIEHFGNKCVITMVSSHGNECGTSKCYIKAQNLRISGRQGTTTDYKLEELPIYLSFVTLGGILKITDLEDNLLYQVEQAFEPYPALIEITKAVRKLEESIFSSILVLG